MIDISDQLTVAKLGSILGIWAHPDDEAWSTAGLMRIALENGQRVGVVTATRGEGGETADQDRLPKENLAKIRTFELEKSLASIGKIEHTWLNYLDGKMSQADQDEATDQIASIIDTFKPDTLITFEENGITGHTDHMTIHTWTIIAARKSKLKPLILCSTRPLGASEGLDELDQEFGFSMDDVSIAQRTSHQPDLTISLSDQQLAQKIIAMRHHASQTDQLFKDEKHSKMIHNLVRTENFKKH